MAARMLAIEAGNHLQVAIQGSREGFLEKHALPCRDQLKRGLLVQVQNGRREVVWPDDLRTAEPKLPIPAWDKR